MIAQYHIHPFLAENSRTYDGGLQQQLFEGKARVSVTYFHNEFTNQAEFVDSQYLVQLGVPEAVAEAQDIFGAAVNTLDYRAQGAEVAFQYQINRKLTARAGWTYTDAVVQQSFASSAPGPGHQSAVSHDSNRSVFATGRSPAVPHRSEYWFCRS